MSTLLFAAIESSSSATRILPSEKYSQRMQESVDGSLIIPVPDATVEPSTSTAGNFSSENFT